MNKAIEEILKILYPNIEQLSEKEKLQFEKDKAFLLAYPEEFEKEYNRFIDRKDHFGERDFTRLVLGMCKEQYDRETVIANYIDGMMEILEDNSYITQNFDEFMGFMRYERAQEESMKEVQVDKTKIELAKVFELTEEFLGQIDPSGEMIAEFKKLRAEDKIKYVFPDEKRKKSNYDHGIINYAFTGTLESASDLVHEFMHHYASIKGTPDESRYDHTMFNEFESIYYENAFIRFMNNKGILKNGENPLYADRLKRQQDKDPDNCVLMLLELCGSHIKGEKIDKDLIINTLQKYFPNITDRDEIWTRCSELLFKYCKEHYFPGETVNGPVMYRFNTGLAMKTSLDSKTTQSVYKLVPFLQDKAHDGEFMEQYKKLGQELVTEEKSEDVEL